MTFINYASREINCKIVYYGPGLCGKTTNIQWIFEQANPDKRGKLVSLATETDRTLFFDFLPLDLGSIRGFMEANIESIANLATNLKENGFDIRSIPYVLQLNKRDMPSAAQVPEMERLLRFRNEPMIEAVANKGTGVIETLKAAARQVLMELQRA